MKRVNKWISLLYFEIDACLWCQCILTCLSIVLCPTASRQPNRSRICIVPYIPALYDMHIFDWTTWKSHFYKTLNFLTTKARTSRRTLSPISKDISVPNCWRVVRNLFSLASCFAPQDGGSCWFSRLGDCTSKGRILAGDGQGPEKI